MPDNAGLIFDVNLSDFLAFPLGKVFSTIVPELRGVLKKRKTG
jgi:hypothetical protein